MATDLYRHHHRQKISIILFKSIIGRRSTGSSKKCPVQVSLGATQESESVPIIGHPVSVILGAKHEGESGDTEYTPILDPAYL